MYGAGFDGEGDGLGLLAAAGAHQAGGPARLPAGGAVPAPVQAHGQPEVVILQGTEVGDSPPLPAALAAEEDLALAHDADGSQQATAPAAGGISPGDEGTGRGASDSLRTQRGRPVHTTADPLMLMHEHEHEEVLNVDRTTRKCCRGRRRRPRQLQRRCPQELDAQLLPQEVQRIAALLARCLAYLCVHPQPLVLAAFDRISTVTDRCSHLRTTPPYTRGLVLRSSLALICLDMSRIICLVSCPTTCVNIRRKRR